MKLSEILIQMKAIIGVFYFRHFTINFPNWRRNPEFSWVVKLSLDLTTMSFSNCWALKSIPIIVWALNPTFKKLEFFCKIFFLAFCVFVYVLLLSGLVSSCWRLQYIYIYTFLVYSSNIYMCIYISSIFKQYLYVNKFHLSLSIIFSVQYFHFNKYSLEKSQNIVK